MMPGTDFDYYIGQDSWFDANWTAKVTPQFAEWWQGHYGLPSAFPPEFHERHEYFMRMAFALMGWLAAKERV